MSAYTDLWSRPDLFVLLLRRKPPFPLDLPAVLAAGVLAYLPAEVSQPVAPGLTDFGRYDVSASWTNEGAMMAEWPAAAVLVAGNPAQTLASFARSVPGPPATMDDGDVYTIWWTHVSQEVKYGPLA